MKKILLAICYLPLFGCLGMSLGAMDAWDEAHEGADAGSSLGLGSDFSCALDSEGEAFCWGRNDYGMTTPAQGPFLSLGTADHFSMIAARVEGGIAGWGSCSGHECSSPSDDVFNVVSAGWDYSCGITVDGELLCWGDKADDYIMGLESATGEYVDVDTASLYMCAVRSDGGVQCWDSAGEMDVPAGDFVSVSADICTCALGSDGQVTCWWNTDDEYDYGQCDPPDSEFMEIGLGSFHACGLRTDGSLECWGDWGSGTTDAPGGTNFVDIAVGGRHSCAISTAGKISCWGRNVNGECDSP